MTTFFETMANVDFCMFLLGAFGIHFFTWIHKMIPKCNALCVRCYLYCTDLLSFDTLSLNIANKKPD